MKKKATTNKPPEQEPHEFNVGDTICNQFGHYKVITKVLSWGYEFMWLQDHFINSVPPVKIKRGDISSQTFGIFDKSHYLYQFPK